MNMSTGRDPDQAKADEIAKEVLVRPSHFGLSDVISVESVTGGVAHHVYRINTRRGRFYLKHRGNHFPDIPGIRTNPSDIVHEYKALSLLSGLVPECFPRIVFFDAERAFMLLTDAMPGEVGDSGTLEFLLIAQKVGSGMLRSLGAVLRRVHEATRRISEPIRAGGDDEFFALKLQHRFGFRNNSILNRIVTELTYDWPRQIIIGDPSPKNVGVSAGGERLVFFDLEDVHRGCVVFDVGFCLGHLVLHAYPDPQQAVARVEAFSEGYSERRLSDCRLAKAVALGTVIYRLAGIIPYPVPISPQERAKLLNRAEAVLSVAQARPMSWNDLIDPLLPGR
jgi:hypothetical protein